MHRKIVAPTLVWALATASAWSAVVSSARAYPDGAPLEGCHGCHGGGSANVQLSLALQPAQFAPGERVKATLTVYAPGARTSGVFINTEGVGVLSPRGGELSRRDDGLAHVAPKPLRDGRTQFRFSFRAPHTKGTVRMAVYALAANGNGETTLDTAAHRDFQFAFGCEGQPYYTDADEDGYGRDTKEPMLACQGDVPAGHAAQAGDCHDRSADVHPGAPELCDALDNDCNGQVDDDAELVPLWPDRDGDGYYTKGDGGRTMGCVGRPGYAAKPGDCGGDDAHVHPDAREVCNDQDEDCDGEVDEQARPTCGVGACVRASTSCDAADCAPGEPAEERCNYIDDDCDGQSDEGGDALCAAGERCKRGRCVVPESDGADGADDEPVDEDAGASQPDVVTPDEPHDDAGVEGEPDAPAEGPRDVTGGCQAAPRSPLASMAWLLLGAAALLARRRAR